MQPVHLSHAGTDLFGELYVQDSATPRPGVLVFHTGLGLGPHVRAASEKLAAIGYTALLADMFGGDFDSDPARTGPIFAQLEGNRALLRDRVVRWFDHFATMEEVDSGRIAAIGYCFGGLCVLELARSGADVKAVSSFHGLLTTHASAMRGSVKGEVAAWCAGRDPFVPISHIDTFRHEMADAGVNLRLTLFENAAHGFTDPDSDTMGRDGIGYDRVAADAAWAGTVALLERTLRVA